MSNKDVGQTWLQRGRADLAEKELRRALADDPNDSEVMVWLSQALLSLDREDEAMELAQTAVGIDPEWTQTHLTLARCHLALRDAKRAAEVAQEAIKLDPEHAGAWYVLAICHANSRRWEQALEAAEKSLEIDPEYDSAANLRAQALIQLGRAEDADLALEASLRHNPEDPEVHEGLGWKALHEGDHKAAIEHYREALRLDPDSDSARAGMVEALNARNVIYRSFLRFSLWLTRLPAPVVFMVMIGLVVGRRAIRTVAESAPALAPILMPVYYFLFGACLFTWVAAPLFNTLLRFDRDGKYALDRVQVRQANWFAGWLALVVATVIAWITLEPILVIIPTVVGALLIPIVTAAGEEGKQAKVSTAAALVLTALGMYSAIQINRADNFRIEAVALLAEIGLEPEDLEGGVTGTTEEEARVLKEVEGLLVRIQAMDEKSGPALNAFVIGFVAFTWIGGGSFSTGTR